MICYNYKKPNDQMTVLELYEPNVFILTAEVEKLPKLIKKLARKTFIVISMTVLALRVSTFHFGI